MELKTILWAWIRSEMVVVFLVFKEPKEKKQGKESCKLNFCGLEDIRWLCAKTGSVSTSGAEVRAP